MMFTQIGAAIKMACFAAKFKKSGLWLAVRAFIDGRNAVAFERERRATLLMVPPMQQAGTVIYDRRPDGSILSIQIPADQVVVYAAALQSYSSAPVISGDQGTPATGIEK
jgi:hypothetical protein